MLSRIILAHNAFVDISDYAYVNGLKSILSKAEDNAERLFGLIKYLESKDERQLAENRRRIKKNPRVYTGKLYPKIDLAIDGNYVGTTAQFRSLKSALEYFKDEFPMKMGNYLVAYYPDSPGSRRIKLKK